MIDETLVPIYTKVNYFGELWYDQKLNYFINLQIINILYIKIINYASGFIGS